MSGNELSTPVYVHFDLLASGKVGPRGDLEIPGFYASAAES